jgi:hypothetical protein
MKIHLSVLLAAGILLIAAVAPPAPRGAPVSPGSAGTSVARKDSSLLAGEELTYNVSFASYDLGRIRVSVTGPATARVDIDTYDGVPFLTAHTMYESRMAREVYSIGFRKRVREDDAWREVTSEFHYPEHRVAISWLPSRSHPAKRTASLTIDTLYQDGLSIFYCARALLFSGRRVTIPVIIDEKKSSAAIDFTEGGHTSVECPAAGYPVDVVHFRGAAAFSGVVGLNGDFEGWFSNDAARVPIAANMKVVLGNVHVELVKWKRAGWTPPRYSQPGGR